MDYGDLLPKCTSNSWFFFKFKKNYLLIKWDYYAKCLLSVQPKFQMQNWGIKKFIQNLLQDQYYMILYYLIFYYELNYIEHF